MPESEDVSGRERGEDGSVEREDATEGKRAAEDDEAARKDDVAAHGLLDKEDGDTDPGQRIA